MNDFNVDESMSRSPEEAVACVTVLTAKPEKLQELLELQLAHHRRVMTMSEGINGVRIYRAIDGTNIVALASLDIRGDRARSTESDIFTEHLDEIGPLIERAHRGYYQLEYKTGHLDTGPAMPDPGSVIWLNIVTAKFGRLDEFIRIQVAEQHALRGSVAGVRGNRIYRSLDESKALMLASFDTTDDHKRWIQSNGFAEHVHKLLPLIERADRGYYDTVYEAGEI